MKSVSIATSIGLAGALAWMGIWASAQQAPVAQAPAAQAATQATTYKVDAVHSSVVFRVQHNEVSYFYGVFKDISGTVALNEKEPAKSSVDLTIKVDSVDTRNDRRDNHLKSPDFFNAGQFPTITFQSKEIKKLDGHNWQVTGDLTLHGVTKSMTVKFTTTGEKPDNRGTKRAGGETTFTINRSDFGMSFMIPAVGDEVTLTVSIEATAS